MLDLTKMWQQIRDKPQQRTVGMCSPSVTQRVRDEIGRGQPRRLGPTVMAALKERIAEEYRD